MVGVSDVSTTPLTQAQIRAAVYDTARSSHVIAGTFGEFFQEMMDQAIQSGHTTDSVFDVLRMMLGEAIAASPAANSVFENVSRLKSTAIASGDTANSIAQKLRGMTDNQAVATTGGLSVANIAVRHSVAQNITTTIQPASGEQHSFLVYRESAPASIASINISVDRTNDVTSYGRMSLNDHIMAVDEVTTSSDANSNVLINDASEWEFLTSATAGTNIIQRIGTIFS